MENTGTKGASVSVWFNYCEKHCPFCWNKDTWKRDTTLFINNDEVVHRVIEYLSDPLFEIKTLALLGGDPLSPKNIQDCLYLVQEVKKVKPDIEIICWTGFTWNQVHKSKLLNPILKYIDILIDGRFFIDLKVEGKHYGSTNQRIINVPLTLSSGEMVEMELD